MQWAQTMLFGPWRLAPKIETLQYSCGQSRAFVEALNARFSPARPQPTNYRSLVSNGMRAKQLLLKPNHQTKQRIRNNHTFLTIHRHNDHECDVIQAGLIALKQLIITVLRRSITSKFTAKEKNSTVQRLGRPFCSCRRADSEPAHYAATRLLLYGV